jgi:uncharacterized protein (TIGR02246 family)
MLKILLLLLASITCHAQTSTPKQSKAKPKATPKSQERTRRTTPTPTPKSTPSPRAATKPKPKATPSTESGDVTEAFDRLIEGIRKADAEQVMSTYWNSPELVIFNNNGTVTKSWDQVRENRRSVYAGVKEVKLEVRDLKVRMIGRDAALIHCLWTQSQNFKGQTENSTGRLTIVFRKIDGQWKAIHAHTSPETVPTEPVNGSSESSRRRIVGKVKNAKG